MRQRWSHLLFLHWPISRAAVQSRLPAGLYADTFRGSAWLGIVPFSMERVRPVGLPSVPKLSWFLELNVRTYVHDDAGNPGVWFFSLDCNQPLAVEVARRWFHLPYEHASMKAEILQRRVKYEARRKMTAANGAHYDYHLPETAAEAAPGSLEWFLVERYLLFSARPDGTLFSGAVHHAPYRIAEANGAQWSAEPLLWDGFPHPACPPLSMLVAEPVDVSVFPLRRLPAAERIIKGSGVLASPASG